MSQNLSYTLDNNKVTNFFKWLRGEKSRQEGPECKKKNTKLKMRTRLEMQIDIDPEMEKAKKGTKKEEVGKGIDR